MFSFSLTEFLLMSNRLAQLADILLLQLCRLVPDPGIKPDMDHSATGKAGLGTLDRARFGTIDHKLA
jgi:hypothetical protein